MPFRSEKQRRFMFAKHPEIAKRWAAEEHEEKHEAPSEKGRTEHFHDGAKHE
jgi:hypothetical protein